MRIFETFTPDEPALTVSEISRRTGLHLMTASQLMGELPSHGFLTRDADRRGRIGEDRFFTPQATVLRPSSGDRQSLDTCSTTRGAPLLQVARARPTKSPSRDRSRAQSGPIP
ncbi:helix-turn-helix domain-containing protein [Streptomyces phaeochromogenes]